MKRALYDSTRQLRRRVRGRYAIRPKKSSTRTSRRGYRASKLTTLRRYNLHDYVRWGPSETFNHSSGTSSLNSKFFAMSESINYGELIALYDQYKVTGVKMTFQLMNNPDATYTSPNTGASQINNFYPKLWYVRDYDDVATDSISDLKQRNNVKCKILRPNQTVSVFLKPALKCPVYLDGVTNAYAAEWNKWIDCTNPTVPYYGVKYAVDSLGLSVAAAWSIRIEYKYYLKFKNVR